MSSLAVVTTTNARRRWPNSSSSTPMTATSSIAGVVGEQVLDLAREDVLAAGDDHLVVAAVDEQPPALVEVPDVAGDISPSIDLLAAAAGVALELHLVADEDAAVARRAGTSRPSSS